LSHCQIFLSASHARALKAAAEWLSARASPEALVLAPTRAAADEFARQAAAAGVLGLHRLTLTQLASELALPRAAGRGLAPLNGLGREALAARVTHRLRTDGKLSYFDPVAAQPGFARALASTLDEVRMQGVSPVELAQAGAPGADLALLASLYAQELEERSLADAAVLFRLASEVADSGGHRFAGLPLVLLDIPLDSEAHRALIGALVAKSGAVVATAHANDERNARWLEEIFGARPELLASDPAGGTLERLRQQVFSTQVTAAQDGDDTLAFFSAPGEGLECVEIARRLLRLAGQGISFDRTAILLRSPERYHALVEEALRRAGVPGYFSRGSARPDPAGRAFLALLACAAEGCTASRFAEYLSLGQVPAVPSDVEWVAPQDEALGGIGVTEPDEDREEPEARTGLPHFAWEKLLVDAAVVGGRERWQRRLKGLEQEFRLKLAALKEEDRGHIERRLTQLQNLEQFALPLIDTLASLPAKAAWGEWLDRLADVARTALRTPETVLSVLAELEPMSEVGPVDLDEVFAVLSDRLRFLRREPPPRRYGRVFVGTIEEARARSFDVVFLPGLAEGLFPRRAFEDPLLLDDHRAKLERGLLMKDDRVARERMLLRTAAAAAATRLVVSFPRMDAVQARQRVPSFYAMEVVRAAEGRLPDLRQFEKRAASAAPSRLGWPAPKLPAEAIDDAEYDLAWLGPLVTLPREQARGKGRYLIEVNPHLARALRTRGRRWRNFFSGADGIVDPDLATRAALAKHRLSARAYSPSGLQHYAACPYRFLLHSIHGLRPREEPVALEQMDPLTRGSLFHAVQFELFHELEKGESDKTDIYDLADSVVDRVAADYADRLAPAIPRVWSTEVEDVRMDLRGWIRHLAISLAEWKPVRYELSFGLPIEAGHDPDSSPEEAVILDGVRLRGSMDVVERNEARGVLRVTDHKTGKPPDAIPKYVGGGALLQPLLYALAAERLLDRPVTSGRLFYCTQRGNYTEIDIPLTEPARAFMGKVTGTIDGAIADGFLPAAPQAHACETCDYTPVCGPYEQQRLRGKQRDERLEPLIELRSTP
jgi:ATP-dependent helicase/nuclease subunit B